MHCNFYIIYFKALLYYNKLDLENLKNTKKIYEFMLYTKKTRKFYLYNYLFSFFCLFYSYAIFLRWLINFFSFFAFSIHIPLRLQNIYIYMNRAMVVIICNHRIRVYTYTYTLSICIDPKCYMPVLFFFIFNFLN